MEGRTTPTPPLGPISTAPLASPPSPLRRAEPGSSSDEDNDKEKLARKPNTKHKSKLWELGSVTFDSDDDFADTNFTLNKSLAIDAKNNKTNGDEKKVLSVIPQTTIQSLASINTQTAEQTPIPPNTPSVAITITSETSDSDQRISPETPMSNTTVRTETRPDQPPPSSFSTVISNINGNEKLKDKDHDDSRCPTFQCFPAGFNLKQKMSRCWNGLLEKINARSNCCKPKAP